MAYAKYSLKYKFVIRENVERSLAVSQFSIGGTILTQALALIGMQ